jgi:hypothetical protein
MQAPHLVLVMGEVVRVTFYGDQLWGYRQDDHSVLVALKPIAEGIGLDWGSQFHRVKRDPILSKGIVILTIPSGGGDQEAVCLPLRLLPGWLNGISANSVKESIRDKVIKYQEECYEVLAAHFLNGGLRGAQFNELIEIKTEQKRQGDMLEEVLGLVRLSDDWIRSHPKGRAKFTPTSQQLYVETIETFYDGYDPIYLDIKIVENGQITDNWVIDHHYSRKDAGLEEGMPTCKRANTDLEKPKFWEIHQVTFKTFQTNLQTLLRRKQRQKAELLKIRDEALDRDIADRAMTTTEWRGYKNIRLI